MIAVKLSVKQLIEALRGLTEREKVQVREALSKDLAGQNEEFKEAELTSRYKQAFSDAELFEQGKLKTYSLSELLDEL